MYLRYYVTVAYIFNVVCILLFYFPVFVNSSQPFVIKLKIMHRDASKCHACDVPGLSVMTLVDA